MLPAALPPVTLILGGARSGKSVLAERMVADSRLERVYVATAQALDDEMRARIGEHRARCDRSWRTVEAPIELSAVLTAEARPTRAVLVDCLTLWLTNLLLAGRDVVAGEASEGNPSRGAGGCDLLQAVAPVAAPAQEADHDQLGLRHHAVDMQVDRERMAELENAGEPEGWGSVWQPRAAGGEAGEVGVRGRQEHDVAGRLG